MADNLGLDIIDPYNMEKIVWNYNHAPHRTLSKLFHKKISPKQVFRIYQEPNNPRTEQVLDLLDLNAAIISRPGFKLGPGTKVLVFKNHNTLKKRNKVLPDIFIVEDFIKNKYLIHKENNFNEKLLVPRFLLNPILF